MAKVMYLLSNEDCRRLHRYKDRLPHDSIHHQDNKKVWG